ncbi:endonuclease/exonuclease/phosphatase family protein [Paenibacillus thiaminolyticus]|uniref:Endonuclease/exonuclease/phosphatase family protein n=1 Tax=Paenibacillus thiaminolyticus TaxID=49283 RepID=A0AAP9IZI3_PANTH|nr:endonuclease/exonuclease/phosphatase family protein [Paenibacillus thiaminolyticus]MCY9536911.1 endonuclease/exonuclease/phosphatase family protein [Paenibacillus thiaminolyticus]MCY9603661.1 endonuclease/exonuclease/phosphatase family protein [Paenibacillus thiaminolyticus]MCY9606727.1 endonuclease/exonuclease/phosphatase family protein [Paenibacillus thiaminolyticus]MCY9612805.1 endonuclease/exonuclease/phosphatase family protein [Paenibacillus thiaminolyticus]MCY9619705.1 endonuclease/ex
MMLHNENQSLRCMSFNIRYGSDNTEDGEQRWSRRADMVASMIRFHRADTVGMQEALRHQIADLERMLHDFGWVGKGREDGADAGEYCVVFYRKSRLEPLENGTFWLSETPEVPGRLGWDAACPRIATWVRFEDKLTGTRFIHFNTHFDHVGTVAMEQSALLLLNRIEKLEERCPVIVTGDFNCSESSVPYGILTGAGNGFGALRDARYAAQHPHFGPSFTFHGFQLQRLIECLYRDGECFKGDNGEDLDSPIDYIFVNEQVRVLQYGVLADQQNGRFPSDHMPVVADILWNEQL